MTAQDVDDHIEGRRTYGIYILRSNATVRTAVIDMDLKAEFRGGGLSIAQKDIVRREKVFAISRIREIAAKAGLEPLVEFSGGKGFHFWFLLETPAPAA